MIQKFGDGCIMNKVGVVLPAGGIGSRMGAEKPKQLLEIAGKEIWKYALDVFETHELIDEIVIVCHESLFAYFKSEVKSSKVSLVQGGKERWQSVENGVNELSSEIDFVMVHDVARPFLSKNIVTNCIDRLKEGQSCMVAKPCVDTVKWVVNAQVEKTIDRAQVWLAQTPQCFPLSKLKSWYEMLNGGVEGFLPTDEASIAERFGESVRVVEGDSLNDKVTLPEDLIRMEAYQKLNKQES
jgi:2-C-methyl-D-erythritol 4-phosphate cytidylyltransferase